MNAALAPSIYSTLAPCAPTPGTTHYNHSNNLTFENEPSERHESEGNSMPTNRYEEAENFSSAGTKPRAFVMTQREWRMESRAAFRKFTKDLAKPSHVIADILECNPKTAQSWLDGDSTPAGILDLRAMSRIPEYAALKRKLAEQESTLDPRIQQTIQELHRMSLELAGGVK